ncbi:hypothetical protein HYS79_02370 [Patescibacteria group bacterium]|nr:hypothetical protein [Patescibacteria group bacterium]
MHRNTLDKDAEEITLAELQVLLSQLRTQLSIVRTGVGALLGALSLTFLILANQWTFKGDWAWLNMLFYVMLGVLVFLGLWRMAVAERKLVAINKIIHNIERKDKHIEELIV